MDRFLYIAMSGARETLRAQAANNHNLANASTTGFRAEMSAFQTRSVSGSGFASRAYATQATQGWDATPGGLMNTGRALDVAVDGQGWIAVQAADGTEAYTRAGELRLDPNGLLTHANGALVLGEGGPISVPPHASLTIGRDGTVSVVPQGQGSEAMVQVGRIKLVAATDQLERAENGLFRARDGEALPADASVQLLSGMLESSNVNTAAAMVEMITLARRFDLQVKAMRTAEDNAGAAAQLLRGV